MKTQTGMTKYLRDGFLPIPTWINEAVDGCESMTSRSLALCESMINMERQSVGRLGTDGGLTTRQSVGAFASMMQRFRECGERIVVVDEADLLQAELTESLQTIRGEDLTIPFPSFLLWFPRAIDGVTSHLVMVQAVGRSRDGISEMQFKMRDQERPVSVRFRDPDTSDSVRGYSRSGERRSVILRSAAERGLQFSAPPSVCDTALAITIFHTCRPTKPDPLLVFGDEETETSVLPLYEGASLLDSWTVLCDAEAGIKTRDSYTGERPPSTVVDQSNLVVLKTLNVVAHVVSVMSWYPEFVSSTRVARRSRSETNPKKKKTEMVSVMRVRQVVEVDVQNEKPTEGGGTPKSQHWRRGHWRRQRHGPGWELANPDAPAITMSDGGRAHMKQIPPLLIAAKKDRKVTNV